MMWHIFSGGESLKSLIHRGQKLCRASDPKIFLLYLFQKYSPNDDLFLLQMAPGRAGDAVFVGRSETVVGIHHKFFSLVLGGAAGAAQS